MSYGKWLTVDFTAVKVQKGVFKRDSLALICPSYPLMYKTRQQEQEFMSEFIYSYSRTSSVRNSNIASACLEITGQY